MRLSRIASVGSLLLGATAARAQLPPELDAYIEAARRAWDVPGLAIAVVRGDSVIAAKGWGVRTLGRPERVDGNTVFNVASLTKTLTATAAATVVDEGKLRWDDPVRRYLPWVEFPDPYLDRAVTLRDVLSHRVGLFAANMMWVPTGIDRREILRRIRFLPAEAPFPVTAGTAPPASAPFRTAEVYSNVLFTLGGEVAATAAGTTWEELVRTRLVVPLGMDSTVVRLGDLGARTNVASPHVVLAGVQRPVPQVDYASIAPAGSVYSTASDMARWLRFQLGDGAWNGRRLVSAAALEEIHSPQVIVPTTAAFRAARLIELPSAYGMGWNVWDFRGRPMLWHGGNADGMPSYLAILPKERLGVVVLINTWKAPNLHGALAARILDGYLGLPTRDHAGQALAALRAQEEREAAYWRARDSSRVRGTRPTLPLAAYAGTYVDSLYGETRIAVDGDHLTLQMGGGPVADLAHWHYDTFDVRWRDPVFASAYPALVSFVLGAGGRVNRFAMPLDRDLVEGRRTR